MNIKTKFGNRVAFLRNEKGISQEKLAEYSNLHRTYISSLESGKRNVALQAIEKLAQGLECNINHLFNF